MKRKLPININQKTNYEFMKEPLIGGKYIKISHCSKLFGDFFNPDL